MAGLAVLAARHTAGEVVLRIGLEGHRMARANGRHMAAGGAEGEERRIDPEERRRAEEEAVVDILRMGAVGKGDSGPEAAGSLPAEDIRRTVAEVGDIDRGEEGDIAGRSLAAALNMC